MSVEKEDKILFCKDCGEEFIFSIREQDFYAQKGFENDPVRCGSCRANRKRQNGQSVGMGAAHSNQDPTDNYYDREATSYASNSFGNGRSGNYGNSYNGGGGYNNQRPNNYGNGGGYGNQRPNNYGNGGNYGNQRPNNYGNGRPNNYGNSYGNGGGYSNGRPNNYGNSYNGGGGYNNQRPNNYGNGGGYGNQRPNNYGNSYGNGGNYGNSYGNQGGYTNQLDRPRYPITCANCGVKTEVPFVPRDGVPVFCRTCYNNQKPNRN